MKHLLLIPLLHFLLLLFLLPKDKHKGEKKLFERQRWRTFDIFVVFSVYNLAMFLFFYLTEFHFVKMFIAKNPYFLHLSLLIFIVLFFKFKIKQSITSLGFSTLDLRRNIIFGITIAFIALVFFGSIFFLLGKDPSSLKSVQLLKSITHPWYYVTFFFGTLVLLGPLVEEIFFRGILYSSYRRKYGPKIAIFFTTLFFVTIHIGGNYFEIIIFGIILTILYEKTESLFLTFITHASFNLFYTLFFYYLIRTGRI